MQYAIPLASAVLLHKMHYWIVHVSCSYYKGKKKALKLNQSQSSDTTKKFPPKKKEGTLLNWTLNKAIQNKPRSNYTLYF